MTEFTPSGVTNDFSARDNEEEIQLAITQLPDGARVVFSLYLIEGFQHKEIAKKLGISESTSKSQFIRAKKLMKQLLKEENYVEEIR